MFEAKSHPLLVPDDGSFDVRKAPTAPEQDKDKDRWKELLADEVKALGNAQYRLHADGRYAVLIVFQALDAAGKDGMIRHVFAGVNPVGLRVASFRQPTENELAHDFLWRTTRQLPARGSVTIFNRSYYEEVLVVRVHPEFLDGQKLPRALHRKAIWDERLKSIRDMERHLARNGTVVLKFWLNVSKDEQRERFLARIDEPESNWKFSASDVHERGFWDDYMNAYEQALNHTSRAFAPWYAIPADNKAYMRRCVAEIIVGTLERLDIGFPEVSDRRRAEMVRLREELVAEEG